MNARRLLALLLLVCALPAGGQTRFVFSPQWTAQAQFAGYYVAKEMGFYEEEGLDVEIVHPFATQKLEKRVRSREGMAYSMFLSEAIELVDKGIPLTLCTDNPGISRTTLSGEYLAAARMAEGGLTQWESLSLIRQGFLHAFLPAAEREKLLKTADKKIFKILINNN